LRLDEGLSVEGEEWIAKAKEALVELVDIEHAIVPMEARAKACNAAWDDYPAFDPDILNAARAELFASGDLTSATRPTKGGRTVSVLHLPDLRDRETDFRKAAARKRALQTRYIGWTIGNKRSPEGFIGPAAEAVVQKSLRRALDVGYVLENDGKNVTHLLGSTVEGGPLDCAAHLLTIERGKPLPITIPIEVKNIRGWIYPNSQELYQLLYKAAHLQRKNRDHAILPVMVTRRIHYTAGLMARELGFFLTELWTQYVKPSISKRLVDEVRAELGYRDLVRSTKPNDDLVRTFRITIPREAARLAQRWSVCGSRLIEHFARLREDIDDRRAAMSDLYVAVRQLSDWQETWPLKPTHLGF
jgi:hypothetical protein